MVSFTSVAADIPGIAEVTAVLSKSHPCVILCSHNISCSFFFLGFVAHHRVL
jgi:hypothetical protein